MLFNVEIVDDTKIANTATPGSSLSLEPLDITAERILLHSDQGVLNARLIFCRQFLKLFLRGAGDLEVPGHCVSSH